jgi:hypothetical protein
MSYFGICDDYLRVSPDQVRKVREVLHTAKSDYISACAHHVDGTQTSYGAGCPGTGGVAPAHGLTGLLEVGSTINFRVSSAAPSSLGLLIAGDQRVQVSLAFIGMNGCHLLVNGTPSITFITNSQGNGAVPATVPSTTSLIGAVVTSQVAVLDAATANPLQVVVSNGVELSIGGDR